MRLNFLGSINLSKLEAENSLPISVRSALVTLPNGGFDQDRGNPVFKPNTFSLRLVLKESDNILNTSRNLQRLVMRGRTLLTAKERDGTFLQTWVKVLGVQREANVKTYKAMQPLVITMEQDYPYWLSSTDEPLYADSGLTADSGLVSDSGNVTSIAVNSTLESATIDNEGTAVINRGTITITVDAASDITDMRITNATNSTYIQYSGTLVADDVLVYDLLSRTATLNGTDVFANVTLPDDASYWLPLELDENTIQVTADSVTGTLTVDWQWSKHYL
jgi:hypothetical protein